MVKAVEFLPKIRYWECPAFQLLISCLAGVLLFLCDCAIEGTYALSLIALGITIFVQIRKHSSFTPHLRNAVYLIILAILFTWFAEFRTAPARTLPLGITSQEATLIILSPNSASLESEQTFEAKVKGERGYWFKVLIKTPHDSLIPLQYHYGGVAIATLDLSSLSSIKDKGYRRYLQSEGYEAIGNIHSISSWGKVNRPSLRSRLTSYRNRLISNFETTSITTLTPKQRGLIYALSLGDRSYLPKSVKETFTSSGVAHILAVSGFHLGVIFAFLSSILHFVLPKYRHRYWKYSLLILGLITYSLMSGASNATLRALIMSIIILVARLIERPTDPIQLLSLTLLIFIVSNPYSLWSIGLVLSLSAVWGIFVFLPIFKEYFHTQFKILQYVFNIILVSISAQLGVLPFLFYYFGSATFSFIWSNIPLVVLSGVLIPLSLLALILNILLGSLPAFITQILGWLSKSMIEITSYFAQIQGDIHFRFDLPLLILYFIFLTTLHPWLYHKANQHYIKRLT